MNSEKKISDVSRWGGGRPRQTIALGVSGDMNSICSFTQELVEIVSEFKLNPAAKADFNAHKWVSEWINCPLAALGGKKPVELFRTWRGRVIVKQVLRAMESGAYM